MESACVPLINYEPMSDGGSLVKRDTIRGDDHKKRLIRVATPNMQEFYQPFTHSDCVCNQERALRNRVMGAVPLPTPGGLNLLRAARDEVTRSLPRVTSYDVFALANRHTGAKRERYHSATLRYLDRGVSRVDSYLSMFVKAERLNPGAKVDPDPRAIQFRSAVYCVALSQHLRPCEDVLYQLDNASDGVPPSRNVAKSLNQGERAMLLVRKMAAFDAPLVIGLDMSRFDKHVAQALLKLEAQIYLFMNQDPEFRKLLEMQQTNTGFTKTGLKYKVKGRRCSGDMNTAIGNVVLMLLMLIALCRIKLRLARWDCLDDGDDALLIVEQRDLNAVVAELGKTFLSFGMVAKIETPTSSVFGIEFCQSRVVEYSANRYKFVRDYRAVISKALCGIRHWENESYRRSVIRAIGTCELALSLGVPVLQAYAVALLRNAGGKGDVGRAPGHLVYRAQREARAFGVELRDIEPVSIEQCARESFEASFGLCCSDQLSLERKFASWQFEITGLVQVPLGLDFSTWDYSPSVEERHTL